MNIIDGLPTLSGGGHCKDEGKACVMEYVSILAGEAWSDAPKCTNHELASTAIHVNDNLDDEDRHLLVPYISRLVGAGVRDDSVNEAIETALRDYYEDSLVPCAEEGCEGGHDTVPDGDARTPYFMGLLDAALDAYDKATGRTDVPELSNEALRELAEAVAA